MIMKKQTDFLGVPLSLGITIENVCRLLDEKDPQRFITFVNPFAWAVAKKEPQYLSALKQMSVVLPDGESVAKLCRVISGDNSCQRISFDMSSLAGPFFETLARNNHKLMLIGGQPALAEEVGKKISGNYPGLQVVGADHGYGDIAPKVAAIMNQSPDAVIVAMGAPRQEMLLLALRDAGYKGVAITCGGFLNQYLEKESYYPKWIDKLNLRFAYRLYKEPRRLWRRYFIDYQVFVWRAINALAAKHIVGLVPAFRR